MAFICFSRSLVSLQSSATPLRSVFVKTTQVSIDMLKQKFIQTACFTAVITAGLVTATTAQANTLAYWRFEGDGVTTPTAGVFMKDTNGRNLVTGPTADGLLAVDSSGNGNSLYTWDNNTTGHQYQNNVPAAIIPQTGAPNSFGIRNNGGNPASFTWSLKSLPTSNVQTVTPTAWTIEASIFASNITGNRTVVGRDGNGVATGTVTVKNELGVISNPGTLAGWSPLYFQQRAGRMWVQFTDVDGRTYQLADTLGTLSLNSWYNVAAVSDGTTLSLYRDSGAGYLLAGSMSLLAGNTALAYDLAGASGTAGDTEWGWTVGRGRFGTTDTQGSGHVDRWLGDIDEVRISDSALTPSQFLFTAVPEPSALAIAGLSAAMLFIRRRSN
jgi:hypothetical protein